jgi:hypothetical protein
MESEVLNCRHYSLKTETTSTDSETKP